MKNFGLIGEKLGHSFSKKLHPIILKKIGIEGDYHLLEMSKDDLVDITSKVRDYTYNGLNVTIPYKEEIMKHLDEISEIGKTIGAVNTIYMKDGKLIGDNTDYYGFLESLNHLKVNLKDKVGVVLGSGGGAKAVVKALLDSEGKVFVVSRDPSKLKGSFPEDVKLIDYNELGNISGEIIVNTTPLGMYPNVDTSPINKEIADKFNYGIDIVYNPKETKFLSYFPKEKSLNGIFMLVGQGVKAQDLWNHGEVDVKKLTFDIFNEFK